MDLPQDGAGIGAFPASDSGTIGLILLGFGPWEKQLDRLDREAGVRQQL